MYNIKKLTYIGGIKMAIKTYLEQTVKSLEAEKEREISAVKDKVTREKIVPYNQDIDVSREKAIAELQSNLNSKVVALQEQFAKDRQMLIEAGEKKKQENASLVIATETSAVSIAYDTAICKLKEQIADLEK